MNLFSLVFLMITVSLSSFAQAKDIEFCKPAMYPAVQPKITYSAEMLSLPNEWELMGIDFAIRSYFSSLNLDVAEASQMSLQISFESRVRERSADVLVKMLTPRHSASYQFNRTLRADGSFDFAIAELQFHPYAKAETIAAIKDLVYTNSYAGLRDEFISVFRPIPNEDARAILKAAGINYTSIADGSTLTTEEMCLKAAIFVINRAIYPQRTLDELAKKLMKYYGL